MAGSEDQQIEQKQAFTLLMRALRKALHHLYNPTELRKSPLVALLGLEQHAQPPGALRSLLLAAIQALKPEGQTPAHAKSWRAYQILRQRFQEQFTQQEVASDLGLSIRHLRREERWAVRLLAEELWTAHQLAARWPQLLPGATQQVDVLSSPAETPPGWAEEITRLHDSLTTEPVELGELLQVVAQLVGPLLQSAAVQLTLTTPDYPLWVDAQGTTLRHALLNILSATIQVAPGGRVSLAASSQGQLAKVEIVVARGSAFSDDCSPLNQTVLESLAIARQLSELSAAALTVTLPGSDDQALTVQVHLPCFERISVVMIEDNPDTLLLVQRYLLHSRYRLIGVSDAEQALVTLEKHRPQVIVLDVMLPGVDGWELLGRLRQHPATHDVPIIVCSILPQESLALALGATAFLRKPFTQQTLLALLDRQLDHPVREAR